jgi:translation initiation factor 4G
MSNDAEPVPAVIDVAQLPGKFAYRDAREICNFIEPAVGEQRRTYAPDAIRALKESCTHRPRGMEDAAPDCGYDLIVDRAALMRPQASTKKGDSLADVAPLQLSENRWVAQAADVSKSSAELVVKNVRGILNKLSTANFARLFQQIIDCGIANATVLTGVIDLVYDKAVTEHTFCGLYAQLCSSLCEKMPELPVNETETTTFRKILLRKCQTEFENRHRVLLPEPRDAAAADTDLLEIKRKQRVLGNIKFVGELFKNNLLSETVMHGCIYMLFGGPENIPEEEELEGMCKLITTIGKTLDTVTGNSKMNQYFTRCQQIAKDERTCCRVRFMLQDLDDLRRRGWQVRAIEAAANKAVTTEEKDAARKESEAKKKEKDTKKAEEKAATRRLRENAKSLPKISKADVEDGWAMAGANAVKKPIKGKGGKPPAIFKPAIVKLEPRVAVKAAQSKAGGFAALMGGGDSSDEDEDNEADAEHSLSSPLSSSQEGAVPESAADELEELEKMSVSSFVSEELLVKKTQSLLDEYWSAEDVDEAVLCVRELSTPHFHPQLVCQALISVLERKERHRELAVIMLHRLWSEGVVTESQLQTGIQDVASLVEDLEIDIPLAGAQIMRMLGKLIALGCVRLGNIPRILPFFAEAKIESLLGELCCAVEGATSSGKLQELYDAEESSFPFGLKGCNLVPLSASVH